MFGLRRTCEPPQAGRPCVSVPEDDDDLPELGWTIDGCEEKLGGWRMTACGSILA